jgi:hypothetical protein
VGEVNVTRSTISTSGGYTWSVTFGDAGDLPELALAEAQELTGDSATVSFSTTTTGTSPLGGSFTLSFVHGGVTQTTSSLQHDASAAEMKGALETLANVGTVRVSRSSANPQGGYAWSVTYMGNAGDLPLLALAESQLTGNAADVSFAEATAGTTSAETQSLMLYADTVLASGTFKLSLTRGGSTEHRTFAIQQQRGDGGHSHQRVIECRRGGSKSGVGKRTSRLGRDVCDGP